MLLALVDESVSAAGSVANCRAEADRLADAERQLVLICRRIPPPQLVDAQPVRLSA